MNAPPPNQPPQQPPQGYGQPPPQGYGQPPGYGQAPRPPAPPPKKGASGCLIAVGIVGGLLLLIGLVVSFFVYRFASSPDGKKIVSAVTSGAALAAAAANAPGTKELRGIGCQTAAVVDSAQIAAIAEQFGDAGSTGAQGLVIACSTNASKVPSCDEVAATYTTAVGGTASEGFVVTVTARGTNECEVRYLADGKRAPAASAPHGGTTRGAHH